MKNKSIRGITKTVAGLMTAAVLSLSTITGCGDVNNSASGNTASVGTEGNMAGSTSSDSTEGDSQNGNISDDKNESGEGKQTDNQEEQAGNQGGQEGNQENSQFTGHLPVTYPVYAINEATAKLIGRNYASGDELWCALSGSGAEFVYYGSKLDITFLTDEARFAGGSRARVAVYIDGERVLDKMLNKESESFTVYEGAAKAIDVQIVKLSEAASSTLGIGAITVAEGEWIVPAEAGEHRIEFIGDSITCGYGVDDEDKNHHFSTDTEDVTRAYAYKTAQLLDADYSIFSYSGWGVISGYTGDSSKKSDAQLVPDVYEQMGFSYQLMDGTVKPQDIDWDFTKFQPEAIVLNLGTNDSSYCDNDSKKQEFVNGYVEFLKKIRKNNPNAHIFCALGTMGDALLPSVKSAVRIYSDETGDMNITAISLPVQNSADGLAADWHPTEKTHEKAAAILAAEISRVMGW